MPGIYTRTLKKEQQIALLSKNKQLQAKEISRQKTVRNSFVTGFILVLLLVFVTWNRYRLKQKTNVQLSQALDELKNTQRQLIQKEKMAAFGLMASRVAHEIQNPLNFVNNFSELSAEQVMHIVSVSNEEEKKETAKDLLGNLEKILYHGKRADAIVKDLQKHSRDGTSHEYFEENKS